MGVYDPGFDPGEELGQMDHDELLEEVIKLRAEVEKLRGLGTGVYADAKEVARELEQTKLQNDELKGLLLQVLRDHDRGHSPCTCVEIRGHATKASAAQKRKDEAV
jgi:hypothetical protein